MLTLDRNDAGGGSCAYVRWKGVVIEHYNDGEAQLEESRETLTRQCKHLESLGVVPRTNTVCWHWSWFETCPADSPYLPLLKYCPGLYEHGETPETVAAKRERSVPPGRLVEPDGSVIFQFGGSCVKWDGEKAELFDVEPDELGGLYHPLFALDYHLAHCGQRIDLGTCYATYDGVAKWLSDHKVDAAAVQRILEVAVM